MRKMTRYEIEYYFASSPDNPRTLHLASFRDCADNFRALIEGGSPRAKYTDVPFDPLIVTVTGWDGDNPYLLHQYDTTPLMMALRVNPEMNVADFDESVCDVG